MEQTMYILPNIHVLHVLHQFDKCHMIHAANSPLESIVRDMGMWQIKMVDIWTEAQHLEHLNG